jgi:hypothetical protein
MKYIFQTTFVIAASAWMGCGGATARKPPVASSPTGGGEPRGDAASTEREGDAMGEAAARSTGSEELAAYEQARPVFAAYCAGCHTSKGATARPEALEHFSMDSYPFGGHHASEITGAVREVLGATGSKPTMPADRPGAVKGEDLRRILSWADAADRAHAASEKGAPNAHEQGDREHEHGGRKHDAHQHGGPQKPHQHGGAQKPHQHGGPQKPHPHGSGGHQH